MNIYHVIWDNGESWPEDHDERHEVMAAVSEEAAISLSTFEKDYGKITANLCFSNVTFEGME